MTDPLVADALDLIWTHSLRALSLEQIAEQLGVSRRALERHFLQETGHTVLAEITTCRLSRAKRLLGETQLPIKSVAYLAGFGSEERMRVAFVQTAKLSPSAYRGGQLRDRKPPKSRP